MVTFSLIASRNAESLSGSTSSEKPSVFVPLVTMLHISRLTTLSCLVGVATEKGRGLNLTFDLRYIHSLSLHLASIICGVSVCSTRPTLHYIIITSSLHHHNGPTLHYIIITSSLHHHNGPTLHYIIITSSLHHHNGPTLHYIIITSSLHHHNGPTLHYIIITSPQWTHPALHHHYIIITSPQWTHPALHHHYIIITSPQWPRPT